MGTSAMARSPVPFWWGGMAGFASAFFMVIASILRLAFYFRSPVSAPSPFQDEDFFQDWTSLDHEALAKLWAFRQASAPLEVAMDFIICIALFLVVPLVSALGEAFDMHQSGHKAAKTVLLPCFTFAAVIVVLDLTFNAGAATTSAWIYRDWDLNKKHVSSLTLCPAALASRHDTSLHCSGQLTSQPARPRCLLRAAAY